jgi:hypothetical protein
MPHSAVTLKVERLSDQYWNKFLTTLQEIRDPEPQRWGTATIIGAASLALIWALLFALTWAHWGNISVDNGREMYVPWELTQGKTLYRDIWYPYTPGGPYLNSLLFRLLGARLSVLYWAGSLSALGCTFLLYLTGMRLSSWLAGWTAAAVVLAQAFVPDLFCFPLPYSFGAVYGALATCLFLWIAVHATRDSNRLWVFAAAIAAAAALAFKPEVGAGCYAALAVLIALRGCQARSVSSVRLDLLSILPGIALSLAMIAWMVSLRGVEFITQANIMSWPSNYFMKEYGVKWLRFTGFALDQNAFLRAGAGIVAVVAYMILRRFFKRCGLGWRTFGVGLATTTVLVAIALWGGHAGDVAVRSLVIPPAMVLLVIIATPVAAIAAWRKRWSPYSVGIVVLCSGAAGVAIRMLVGMRTEIYPIYYNGPVILAFLLLIEVILFGTFPRVSSALRPGRWPVYLAVLAVACIPVAETFVGKWKTTALKTDRGLIYLSPVMARQYADAIDFMKRAASLGRYTLSVPEDTGLYFLSGTHCPTRIFAFTPGLVAPEEMDTEIRDVDRAPVQYLIWSNRSFPEYGAPEFGTDFDKPLGNYFRSHFRPLRKLLGSTPVTEWSATIWERLPEGSAR